MVDHEVTKSVESNRIARRKREPKLFPGKQTQREKKEKKTETVERPKTTDILDGFSKVQ